MRRPLKRRDPGKVKGISPRQDRGRDTWRIHFFIKGESWSEGPYPTEQECREDAAEYGRRHLKGINIVPDRLREPKPAAVVVDKLSVRVLYLRWLVRGKRGRASGSNSQYVNVFETHILVATAPTDDPTAPLAWKGAFGDLRVSDDQITRNLCIEFARGLIGRPVRGGGTMAHATRKNVLAALSSFLGWARDQADIPLSTNPAADLMPHTVDRRERPPELVVWDHEQLNRFLDTVKQHRPQWYVVFYFAARTGVRVGELTELRWETDWKSGDNAVQIQRQRLTRIQEDFSISDELTMQRDKVYDEAGRVTETKGRAKRSVLLAPDLLEMLERHYTAEKAAALRLGAKRGHKLTLMFAGPRGGRFPVSYIESEVLPELCALAEVPVTTSMHMFRHTYASILLAAGKALSDVSKWLGHQNETMTQRVYGHFVKDVRRDQQHQQEIMAAFGRRRD